jgi:hypothetical protein
MESNIPNQPIQDQSIGEQIAQPLNQNLSVPKKSKKRLILLTVLILVILIVVGTGSYYLATNGIRTQKACTMEAKLCPDGSSVGRSGPNCEFSPCPTKESPAPTEKSTEDDKTEGNIVIPWETYTNLIFGFSIKYPKGWHELDNKSTNPLIVFLSPNQLKIVEQSEGPIAPITIVVKKGTLSQIITTNEGKPVMADDSTFLGLPAKIVNGTYDENAMLPNTSYKRIYFEKNGYTYSLQYLSVSQFSEQDFQGVVSTFNFSN